MLVLTQSQFETEAVGNLQISAVSVGAEVVLTAVSPGQISSNSGLKHMKSKYNDNSQKILHLC